MIPDNGSFMRRLKNFDATAIRHEIRSVLAITEDIILALLAKTAFFRHAALHGETALRLFVGSSRHYGRLDFSLTQAAGEFLWEPWLQEITVTMAEYGCVLKEQECQERGNLVKKCSGKDCLSCRLLGFTWAQLYSGRQRGVIKLRMNSNPPDDAGITIQKQLFQGIGTIRTFDLPALCAEKYQALLCRGYERGQDWYDILRLRSRNIEPNYRYLETVLNRNGPWKGQAVTVNREWLAEALKSRLDRLDFDTVKRDICRFVEGDEYDQVAGWNKEIFKALIYGKLSNSDSQAGGVN